MMKITSLKSGGFIKKAGFTLIETMVAVGILTVAIAVPLGIISQGFISSNYSKNQITAFYLGQEAMEFIEKLRTDNGNSGGTMDYFDSTCLNLNCKVDPNAAADQLTAWSDTYPLLFYNKVSGLYASEEKRLSIDSESANWSQSIFKRTITVKNTDPAGDGPGAPKTRLIIVTVDWDAIEGGGQQGGQITLRNLITCWPATTLCP